MKKITIEFEDKPPIKLLIVKGDKHVRFPFICNYLILDIYGKEIFRINGHAVKDGYKSLLRKILNKSDY